MFARRGEASVVANDIWNKASGIDQVTGEISRRAFALIEPVIKSVVNDALRSGRLPAYWKMQKLFLF